MKDFGISDTGQFFYQGNKLILSTEKTEELARWVEKQILPMEGELKIVIESVIVGVAGISIPMSTLKEFAQDYFAGKWDTPVYKLGQKFKRSFGSDTYVLCRATKDTAVLMCMEEGLPWHFAKPVSNMRAIKLQELDVNPDDFIPI